MARLGGSRNSLDQVAGGGEQDKPAPVPPRFGKDDQRKSDETKTLRQTPKTLFKPQAGSAGDYWRLLPKSAGPSLATKGKSDTSMAMKIEHRIGIAAPAELIWEILADVPGWPAWNPIYPKAAGEVRYGGQLSLTVALPGQVHREIEAPILDWTPNEAIHWRDTALAGFVQTIRFLEIESFSETGCAFSNGEVFAGLLGGYAARSKRRSLKRGFVAVGEALKERAEALWRERSGEAK